MAYKKRTVEAEMKRLSKKSRGRIVVLTGARQVGKSTLAKATFDKLPHIALDSSFERSLYTSLHPNEWIEQYPCAVLDEIQKAPELFNTIKAVYDRTDETRYILLGSSQLLLLKGIKETLAGRAAIRELYPLTIPELHNDKRMTSHLIELLQSELTSNSFTKIVSKTAVLSPLYAKATKAWNYYTLYGGMPALLDDQWDDTDRYEWLQDYQQTFLQRDLMDLARLDQLEPFVKAQKIASLRTSQTINYSEVARDAGVTSPTAKKFIQYLEISYQVHMLQPWYKNTTKRLTKMPKLHFLDPGVRRSIIRKRGDIDGAEFESAVVAEVIKQTKNNRIPVDYYHLRTSDGREVDLLLELEGGYVAIECKMSEKVGSKEIRHLTDLDLILDKPLLLSLVVSQDPIVRQLHSSKQIWNIPAPLLFS